MPEWRIRLATNQTPHLIPKIDQVLREVGAVLSGDAGDQRASSQWSLRGVTYVAAAYRPACGRDRAAYEWGWQARKLRTW